MRSPLILIIAIFTSWCEYGYGQFYSIGGEGLEKSAAMTVCSNQDLLVLGTTSSDQSNSANVLICRLDTNLQCLWTFSLGNAAVDVAVDVVENANQEILVIANSNINNGYDIQIWLLDADGEILWNSNYGGGDWDFASSVQLDGNGGYWITGHTYSFGNGNKDALLIHLNADGSVSNQWTYGTMIDDYFVDIDLLSDGTWLISGNKRTNDTLCVGWLTKLNIDGTLDDFYYFGNDTLSAEIHNTIVHDGSIVHCGHSYQNQIPCNYIARMLEDGTVLWEYAEVLTQADSYLHVSYHNQSYYIAAESKRFGEGGYGAVLYRRHTDGWFIDGLIYSDTDDGRFKRVLHHPNLYTYVLGDFTLPSGETILIVYKQLAASLTSSVDGSIIPVGCFQVGLSEVSSELEVSTIQYYDLIGQKVEPSDCKGLYIERTTFEDGSVQTKKLWNR
jgi:hypothetical protein